MRLGLVSFMVDVLERERVVGGVIVGFFIIRGSKGFFGFEYIFFDVGGGVGVFNMIFFLWLGMWYLVLRELVFSEY